MKHSQLPIHTRSFKMVSSADLGSGPLLSFNWTLTFPPGYCFSDGQAWVVAALFLMSCIVLDWDTDSVWSVGGCDLVPSTEYPKPFLLPCVSLPLLVLDVSTPGHCVTSTPSSCLFWLHTVDTQWVFAEYLPKAKEMAVLLQGVCECTLDFKWWSWPSQLVEFRIPPKCQIITP